MGKIVKTEKCPIIISAYAQCFECNWTDGIHEKNRIQELKNKIYIHVKYTGHKVSLKTMKTEVEVF